MNVKKVKGLFAGIILLLFTLGLGYGWTLLRSEPFSGFDLLLTLVGVSSLVWIGIWTKTKNQAKQSLLVPYFPIFLVPLIAIVSNQLQIISGLDVLNIIVYFYCGFMGSISILGILNLIFGKNSNK